MDKKELIRNHIQGIMEKNMNPTDFGDDESLVLSGLLDSMAVLEIVVFIEDRFGIDFSDEGFDQNDFDTVNCISDLIKKYE